ncbi:hypothetical protein [Acidisoma sp. L85]|uniref:hypothetical protein n=1 Tax=Acidisoma sp. L85 TaxID=1641850 RepID=UPI001C2056EA|nr:hypothetical protein [Acidisoma sp. L85]
MSNTRMCCTGSGANCNPLFEAMDGTGIEQGAGEFSLGEDQGCVANAQGRKGHRSGTIGDQPAVLMTVQLHVPPVLTPCHFA